MSIEVLKQKIVDTVTETPNETLLQNVLNILFGHAQHIDDDDLTELCMNASEQSLAEAWENEDDDRWHEFIKN